MLWTVSQVSLTDFNTHLPVKAPVKVTNLTICARWKYSIRLLHKRVLGSVLTDLNRNKPSRQKRVQLAGLGGWFCFSTCHVVYAYAFKSTVHGGSAFEPGASGLPYYCTSICVRSCCTWRASCVDPKTKKNKNKKDPRSVTGVPFASVGFLASPSEKYTRYTVVF